MYGSVHTQPAKMRVFLGVSVAVLGYKRTSRLSLGDALSNEICPCGEACRRGSNSSDLLWTRTILELLRRRHGQDPVGDMRRVMSTRSQCQIENVALAQARRKSEHHDLALMSR